MSGTSLDGADAVVADFGNGSIAVRGFASVDYPAVLRDELLALNSSGFNEIERGATAAIQLARLYAEAIGLALAKSGAKQGDIAAIGCHGQTIRHRPKLGYTIQLNNPALLAELTGCDVVSDFRVRDIAAGGQGAPLVPAFHDGVFRATDHTRVVVNIGGIANITILAPGAPAWGFDCGPGNCLMDLWTAQHGRGLFDRDGVWSASGSVNPGLLTRMLHEPYFQLPPPKSTGRDLFNAAWLAAHVPPGDAPENVQATLMQLTVRGIADDVVRQAAGARTLLVCGGGAQNPVLMRELARALPDIDVASTDICGVPPQQVEALAFAWLARQFMERADINLTRTTGARHPVPLGCLTRA